MLGIDKYLEHGTLNMKKKNPSGVTAPEGQMKKKAPAIFLTSHTTST